MPGQKCRVSLNWCRCLKQTPRVTVVKQACRAHFRHDSPAMSYLLHVLSPCKGHCTTPLLTYLMCHCAAATGAEHRPVWPARRPARPGPGPAGAPGHRHQDQECHHTCACASLCTALCLVHAPALAAAVFGVLRLLGTVTRLCCTLACCAAVLTCGM